jgi:hypothetical protein
MTTHTLKRYTASIIVGHGPEQGTGRDATTILAIDDGEAWEKAMDWGAANSVVQDGDYLQLSENGRGVKGTPLRKLD